MIKRYKLVRERGKRVVWDRLIPADDLGDNVKISNIYRPATQFERPTLYPKEINHLGYYGFVRKDRK